ncbi:hypothetical protein MUN81_11890 [Hymenobacter sp. 5317J-9]|uniref:hypothetical protein n=1 Tax=Hymenobacter sp. 5317J-9 TaxID=2932250 RepID=UPI001FD702E0|nr:hypothetical protein [Hymenobacter sp. 5317J-9]UOQ95964.1 hypothetical protein MUN81_11890 [Hymenobacter sp. 5317J-9]
MQIQPATQNDQNRKLNFEAQFKNLGVFAFSDSGFTVTLHDASTSIDWQDIRAMFGYKMDLMTTDLICLDIHHGNGEILRLTEETPGWYQFQVKSVQQFPAIDHGWQFAIIAPAFNTNLTLVYEKSGMDLLKATSVYYPQGITK